MNIPSGLGDALLNSSSDAVIATDREGRITFWNPGAERIFGFTAEETSGQSLDLTECVLTVADGPLTDETVIAFVRDDNRLRFDINRASASRRGLSVSSKLLRLARQVRDQ